MHGQIPARSHITSTRKYSKRSLLFIEGGECEGVLILLEGTVKLSTSSPEGRSISLGVVEAGHILGLADLINHDEHQATAEALEDCTAEYIGRGELMEQLRKDAELNWKVIEQLSRDCAAANRVVASLFRAEPVLIRLARLFVSWSPEPNGHRSIQLKNQFTHQQIGEMVGATRETVTRALGEMREQGVLTLKGSDLMIHDLYRLRSLAGP